MKKEEISSLKVVELKAKLSELGLSTSGLKSALVDRLCDYYSNQSASALNPSVSKESSAENDKTGSPAKSSKRLASDASPKAIQKTPKGKKVAAESSMDIDQPNDNSPKPHSPKKDATKPLASPKVKPIASPKLEPIASPQVKPSASPKLKPIASPQVKPSASPKLEPIASPKVKSSASPKLKPANVSSSLNDSVTDSETNATSSLRQLSKNAKKKRRRNKRPNETMNESLAVAPNSTANDDEEKIEIEYVAGLPKLEEEDPLFAQFSDVFKKFDPVQIALAQADEYQDGGIVPEENEEDYYQEDADGNEVNMSKKNMRKLGRMTVAELKQKVKKPEVVEWVDVTASDPYLLVALKSNRNSVPVPQHWSQKRKFLQNKRGMEKAPFELPAFIKSTGIMEIRQSVRDKELTQKLKAKMREKLRPKMGKIDVDYQKLHDAFFKYQTKPLMTSHGDLYYEGKEFEVKYKSKRPGSYSEELKTALGMPPGGPPPWLINMQRFGPPPSYPFMKIPGLNCPIPLGAQWGFHPGGWGKPPVDEFNRPLYGDVFGLVTPAQPLQVSSGGDAAHWGDVLIEEEYAEEEAEEEVDMEEEEEFQEQQEEEEEEEKITPISVIDTQNGLATPSGVVSVPTGLQTPDEIQLKKERKKAIDIDFSNEQRPLYTVLSQKETRISGLMGSQHGYDVSSNLKRKFKDGVDVALDPDELDSLNSESVRAKFEAEMEQSSTSIQKEDFSDMVAEHAAGKSASSSAAKKRKTAGDAKKFKF